MQSMSKIVDFCNSHFDPNQPLPRLLPMVHVTEKFYFRSILDTGILKTKHDTMSDADALFFSYGRPAYVVGADKDARTDDSYVPVSLLVQPTTIEKAEVIAIYPFDSGSFARADVKLYIHSDMELESFHLGKSLDVLQKLVQIFFGDNECYCTGKVKDGLKYDTFDDLEVGALYEYIRAHGQSKLDDRRFTIEIQVGKSIVIEPLDVIAVVLPISFLASNSVIKRLSEWNATPLPYYTMTASPPSAYKMTIFHNVMTFYKQQGML
jgi:hypothetical protein